MEYTKFIQEKKIKTNSVGFEPVQDLNPALFDFQKDIVRWALKQGKACLFEDCGLGKTIQQLEWAYQVVLYTKQPVILLAPLAVAEQTLTEANKFNIPANICHDNEDIKDNSINITNYEKLHKLNVSGFSGVVLDESSILKSYTGHYRNGIIEKFAKTPYKLACSATPAPNDYMELGNHAEFVEAMSLSQMLSMFFVNNAGDVGQWRLKKHAAEKAFWQWVSSWAVVVSNPCSLGYDDIEFELPPIRYHEVFVDCKTQTEGKLFAKMASTLEERRDIRKESIQERCQKAAEIINATDNQWVIWCGLNAEAELLKKYIDNSVEVSGSTSYETRVDYMIGFANRKYQRIITKPKIAGHGMNWQNCNKVMFVGLNDSWEQLYQATRRVWRFLQKNPVDVYYILETREGSILHNLKRKEKQSQNMIRQMEGLTREFIQKNIKITKKEEKVWQKEIPMQLPNWI